MLWLALAGCNPTAPSWDLLRPAAGGVAARPEGPQGNFDFEGEDRLDETAKAVDGEPKPPTPDAAPAPAPDAASEDPMVLQARLLGLPPPAATPPPPAPVAAVANAAPALLESPADLGWGVRVLSVLLDVQPPRAVLGLPDGKEIVVQPGAQLPDQHLLVLAIGRDAVQIARVKPAGYYAEIETVMLPALYPVASAPR